MKKGIPFHKFDVKMNFAFLKTGIDKDIAFSTVGKNNNLVVTFRDFSGRVSGAG